MDFKGAFGKCTLNETSLPNLWTLSAFYKHGNIFYIHGN